MICLLMWGHWDKSEEHTIVVIFGWSLGGFIAAMSMVILGLLTGGPVGRFKGGITKAGFDFETSGVNEPPLPPTVEAAAKGAAAGAVTAASAPASPKPEELPKP